MISPAAGPDRSFADPSFPDIALYWSSEAYTLGPSLIMGRQSAGAGFARAIAAADPPVLSCYAATRAIAESFKTTMQAYGAVRTLLHWVPFEYPEALSRSGLLFRPDAAIWNDGWHRAARGCDRGYSICGITHTTATHATMTSLAALLSAPLYDWDALICTSRAVRASIETILDAHRAHLEERLGATRFAMPRLPVIPLGVDCGGFVFGADEGAAARRSLGIAPGETVVSFVGRLSLHAKAHPVPMYMALEQAARGRPVVLIQAGWFANPHTEAVFREEAARFCPSVRCLFADGRNATTLRAVWAASDIFTSLSDNIQETFGLTPIEAMAAGLPAVVSDWNGYRDTIRDGIDGFRIPTLTLPPGSGGDLAERYDREIDDYNAYIHNASQLVAVHIEAAADGYDRLIGDPALRRRMGEAGRQRARERFDWPRVLLAYKVLWAELAERRTAAAKTMPPARRRPDRPDPFTMFASYPTQILRGSSAFRKVDGVRLEAALARRHLKSIRRAKAVVPPADLIGKILAATREDRWIDIAAIARECSDHAPVAVARASVWLAKLGVLSFRPWRERVDEGDRALTEI
jgi:alpha-maltose-1-phosphate synthase